MRNDSLIQADDENSANYQEDEEKDIQSPVPEVDNSVPEAAAITTSSSKKNKKKKGKKGGGTGFAGVPS